MPSRQQLEIEFEELLNRHSLTINKICWVYSEYNRFYSMNCVRAASSTYGVNSAVSAPAVSGARVQRPLGSIR